MYSGFELCEAAPLGGARGISRIPRDAEIRARQFDAPGNIVAEDVGKLNRVREAALALQTHLGLRFYPAHNDQVIFYGKGLLAGRSLILCAISLDPFHVQEATVEVPLWEWGLPDTASFTAYDLMHDTETVRSGKLQRLRLDPAELPLSSGASRRWKPDRGRAISKKCAARRPALVQGRMHLSIARQVVLRQ